MYELWPDAGPAAQEIGADVSQQEQINFVYVRVYANCVRAYAHGWIIRGTSILQQQVW
jgi:hypothetical protein